MSDNKTISSWEQFQKNMTAAGWERLSVYRWQLNGWVCFILDNGKMERSDSPSSAKNPSYAGDWTHWANDDGATPPPF